MAKNDAAEIASRVAAGLRKPVDQRGMAGLLPQRPGTSFDDARLLPIKDVHPNPYQARQAFSREELDNLTASVREEGVLQPIIVRPALDGFEVVAGERRLRAVQTLHAATPEDGRWLTIPAIVRNLDDDAAALITAIENIQRSDLTITDEAAMYDKLAQVWELPRNRSSREIARRLGISHDRVTRARRIGAFPSLAAQVDAGTITLRAALDSLRTPAAEAEPEVERADLDDEESLTHGASNSPEMNGDAGAPEGLTHRASNLAVRNNGAGRNATVWRPLHLAYRNVSRLNERVKLEDVTKLPPAEVATTIKTVDEAMRQLAELKSLLKKAQHSEE